MPRLLPFRASRAFSMPAAALIAAACQGDPLVVTADPVAATTTPASQPSIDWPNASDCLTRLRLLEHATRTGRLPEDPDAIPIAVRTMPTSRDWITAADPDPDWIRADLPIRVLGSHRQVPLDVTCWIEVGPARNLEADLAKVGREQVRSAYQSGTKSERNPEYELAQLRVRQAEKEKKDGAASIITVGDPMLDLVGLMVGSVVDAIGGRASRRDLEEAVATLAATQRSIERPVWRHYHFERTVLRGQKSALVPISLRSRHGTELHTLIRQRERQTFELLDGLDPRDRDYGAHDAASMSELELRRWSEQPPAIPVSALVQSLIDPTAAPSDQPLPPLDGPAEPAFRSHGPEVVAGGDAETLLMVAQRAAPADGARVATSRALEALPKVASLEALKGGPAPRTIPVATPEPSAALPTKPLEIEAGARDDRPDVVTLHRGNADRGLGVYLSPHTVLTTARVVGDANVLEARLDGTLLPALVAARDPTRDLALIKLSRPGRAAPLDEDATPPESLVLLGAGSPGATTHTLVTGGAGFDANRLRLDLGASVTPAIGAPVLNEGRLVGVVTAVDGSSAVATTSRTIRALLNRLPDSDLLLD